MEVEFTYNEKNKEEVTLVSLGINYPMTRSVARRIGKELIEAADKADQMERDSKYGNIGQKAKAAADKYVGDCLYTYDERGNDYEIFAMGAESLIARNKFDGLNKDQLVNLLLYMLSCHKYMDLPVACFTEALVRSKKYPEELIVEVVKNSYIKEACDGYQLPND